MTCNASLRFIASPAFVAALTILTAFTPVAGRGDADLERSVGMMTRIAFCGSPVFSPDGTRLAFISNISGVPQVWTVDARGGWPTQVTALEDPVGGVDWSPDGAWLAVSVAPGGGMNSQIHLVRPDGTGMKRLTGGGRDNNWLGGFSHDGRLLTLSSNRDNPQAMDAFVYELSADRLRLVARNPGVGTLEDISRDGRWGILSRVRSRGDNDLFLVDLHTGSETLLTPHDPPGSFGGGTFSPDGAILYLTSNKGRDRTALSRIRMDEKGRPGPIETIAGRDDAEVQEFSIDDDGGSAAVVWNAAGRSELHFVDLSTLASRPAPALPAEIVYGLDLSRDGRLLAMTVSGAASPADVWVLDRAAGEIRRITTSPHAGVDLASLVRPELVRFAAHDGLELTGWLYLPPSRRGAGPIVLSFHGGPEGQERPGFNSTYQALLSRGIAVLAPNVRGSSGFGKRFVNLDNGALREDGIRDIDACVRYVVGRGVADPKRIGIMGGSYGGYMVMAGLTRYPDMFAAGANLFGVVNFETFFANTEPWMAAISTIEYGDPETQRELLRTLSPIHEIDKVKAPTLVLHGANDTNVPVVEAEQVVANLRKRGVPVEYVLFPDEGHGFRKTHNRITSAVSIVRWFEKQLNG